ncbi:GspE/PulE family protein [Poriferisphaera sp. WC338]|uniref:GspE/PulE family protein n=1 Tax=Poriferisphaera sp. WC338 TaxID=3425129 RepID=UPI003D818260
MVASTENKKIQAPLRLGDLLVEKGVLTAAQIEHALAFQKNLPHRKLLGEVLVELEFVTEEQVLEVLAVAYDVPFATLSAKLVDANVFELLPKEYSEKQKVLPLFLVGGKLTLAMAEPANVFLVEEIERMTGHVVQVVAATEKDILSTLQSISANDGVFVIEDLVDDIEEADLKYVESQVEDISDIEAGGDESPVIRLVNGIVFGAVRDGASDIHIEPDENTLRVRYRVDGRLYEKANPPASMLPAIVSRVKIMGGMDISERRIPQDGGITVQVKGRQVDLRVSTMPGKFGEKVVIRIIDRGNAMKTLSQLGFSSEMIDRYRQVIHQPNGVVLVTGPTGSGKSTTLYGTLNEINSNEINISTVEDPVEYSIAGVNQFQVQERAGFTFAGALRALLRQDPDVIMVGEVRDEETARIANQAALTGHMVLSTLHTNDAPSAVTRLIDIGLEPYLVAATIRGVLAQRLVRKICHLCKEKVDQTSDVQRAVKTLVGNGEPVQELYHGVGCNKCRMTGYSGRIGIYELLTPSDALLEVVSKGGTLQDIKRKAIEDSCYITLREDGIEKVKAGLTTIDEILRATTV